MGQRPRHIVLDIADETKLAIRFERAGHGGDGCVLHEAPLPVPPLRPGVGMNEIDPDQRALRRPGQQFGGGEHLIAEARAFPNLGFIGCEPYVNGMAKILTQIEAHNIGNIRLFAGDAAELLAWAPPRSLRRIDLIHPDPWPKRRHWKRRFVQDATIAAMARVLKPQGEFRFVSDIDDYGAWTLAHLARSPDFIWTAERASDWRLPWPDYTMTRYGRKAEREGRRAAYLRFRRVG